MKLLEFVRGWLNRYFAHEESLLLVALIATGLVLVVWLGGALAPVLTALIVAFLLQGVVTRLIDWRVPDTLAVYAAFGLFVGIVAVLLLAVLPLVWQQLVAFVNALPTMLDQVQGLARGLPDRYPTLLTSAQIDEWLLAAREELILVGQRVVTLSFGRIGSLVGVIIYLVLVPILVFFFLKDRTVLVNWFKGMLPEERPLLDQVGSEMNQQIANYMRGKALEILMVGGVTFVVFSFLGVNFSALLAILVGFSVLVPFVGAAVVTIPVALVGFVQFGLSWDFGWLMLAYAIIQAIDGNVLVPILFSEAVDLHPVAIIVAVLAFGGIWGFWGVFFAIPLASLVKAVLTAWPRSVADVEIEPFADEAPSPPREAPRPAALAEGP